MPSYTDFAASVVVTAPAPAASGASVVITAGEGARYPDTFPFDVEFWPGPLGSVIPGWAAGGATGGNVETAICTNRVVDTFTLIRAQRLTTARTIVVGDVMVQPVNRWLLENIGTFGIHQVAHGFAVGNVVYLSGTTYAKAKADVASTSEVIGIVSAVMGADDFTLSVKGKVTGLTGLTAGTVYFLSATSAGALTTTEPSTIGHVSKPLLVADSTTSGYFFNHRGMVISTNSHISTDSLWDAAGDMVQGTGADTAARTPIGAARKVWQVNAGGTAGEWTSNLALAETLGVSGQTTLAALLLGGGIYVGPLGTVNNWDPAGLSTTSNVLINGVTSSIITGIVPYANILFIMCVAGAVVLKHANAGSTAANRMNLPGSVDLTIGSLGGVILLRDDRSGPSWMAVART